MNTFRVSVFHVEEEDEDQPDMINIQLARLFSSTSFVKRRSSPGGRCWAS